jgi:hypothetical protein
MTTFVTCLECGKRWKCWWWQITPWIILTKNLQIYFISVIMIIFIMGVLFCSTTKKTPTQ